MRHWIPNQKLTPNQIATIKHLKNSGVQLSLIAQVVEKEYGVSKCIAYYHASENRAAYDPEIKKQKSQIKTALKQNIIFLIAQGLTTKQIASSWGISLVDVNKIYIK